MPSGSDWGAGFDDEPPASLADAELRHRIGAELRASYEALVEEPVPERLAVLLRRIEGEGNGAD